MLFPSDEKLKNISKSDYNRLQISYANKSSKFLLKSKDYAKQYAHIYASRLKEMTKLLEPKALEKWGKNIPVKKLCELREECTEKCIIIGTLFKHQTLKPSILREISEENQLAPQPPRLNFVDESDKLILEDELQRIRLLGKIDVHTVVAGIVCAVLGKDRYVETDGRFIVDDVLYYESGPQKPLKVLDVSPLVVFVSGLDMSSIGYPSISLELFQHWLFGNINSDGNALDWESANIVRVIIAGNSIRTTTEVKQKTLQTRSAESTSTLDAVTAFDNLLSNWSESVIIDVMPGEFDPSNFMLPQQPMHQCMFSKSYNYKSFQSVSNPYECELEDRLIMGTSGQNIFDIMRTSKIVDPIEAMRSTLEWSHLTPTSPDTMPCYPYVEKDPFILEECPHIYFAGNQSEFKTELYTGENGKKTRLVSIPMFSKTQSVAVVNLRTLDCNQMSFKIGDLEE